MRASVESPSVRDDDEPRALVVIAASAGGLKAIMRILSALPRDLPAAVAIVLHRTTALPNRLARVLGPRSNLPVVQVLTAGVRLHAGTVYLAPPDRHLVVAPGRWLDLTDGHRIRHLLSSANPLFDSAAKVYGSRTIAVVLTGSDSDGTDGVQSVMQAGGAVLVQDPATAEVPGMPRSAIASRAVTAVLPLDGIAPRIVQLVSAMEAPVAAPAGAMTQATTMARRAQ